LIKAGRAGSSPDGITTDWPSQPLSVLMAEIGEAIACLNTVVVGLDAVEKGYEKPEALDISWSPHDKRAASRKARKFIVESILVRVFEAIYQHSVVISRLPRFRETVAKWNGDTTKAAKVYDTYKTVVGDTYLVSSAVLVAHWRNRIVHPGSNARLQSKQKSVLRDNESEIFQKYKGLNVDCLLCHFEEGRPTLKDISSLIAMAINLAREVDRHISSNLSKEDFDAWYEYFGLREAIEKVKAETKPQKLNDSIGRVFKTRAPTLLSGYEKYYAISGSE
jgi:hypothetical protein